MLKKIFLIFLFLSYSECIYCCSESQKNNSEVALEKMFSTIDGAILFFGWEDGEYENYDTSKLSKQQKDFYIERGLEEIYKLYINSYSYSESMWYSEILSKYYYFSKKDTKKCIYWALKGAENGSSFCMVLLYDAYKNGYGVVQEWEESIKWMYLAAAAGNEECQKDIKNICSRALFVKDLAPIFKEGQLRAKKWMEDHKDVFLNLD